MTSSLIYASIRDKNCSENDIHDILFTSRNKNKLLGITGVLVYSDTMFVQYLEGDRKQVFDLYEKIKKDKRHSEVILVSISSIDNRLFPSWEMGERKLKEVDFEFDNGLQEDAKNLFQRIV